MKTNWSEWHDDSYQQSDSGLSHRLATVPAQIHRRLNETSPDPVRVISACAGDGRDLLGVLAERSDADRVSALLVEYDKRLADKARKSAGALPSHVEVLVADAAQSNVYRDAAPADLVLLCGIFGNVNDADVQATIQAAPQLCAPGGEVVWTRHRREPDLTPAICGWFGAAGFEQVAFITPPGGGGRDTDTWSVGVHCLTTEPSPLHLGHHWFTFLR